MHRKQAANLVAIGIEGFRPFYQSSNVQLAVRTYNILRKLGYSRAFLQVIHPKS